MTIIHASRHTDVWTADYNVYQADRLSLLDPQNVSGGESGNEASVDVDEC